MENSNLPNQLKEKDKYFKPIDLKKLILEKFPNNINAIVLLSDCYYKEKNLELAQKIIEKALGRFPNNNKLLEQLDIVTEVPTRQVVVEERLLNPRPVNEDKSPLVSITIASYNQEKFIKDCVQSVLSQTYTPLEIIIGDDASLDSTSEIINKTLAEYSGPHQVSFIRQDINLGYQGGGNWHNLLRRTKGEFIVQFSGDDVMHPNMIEAMVGEWKKTNASMIVVNSELIDENSTILEKKTRIPTDINPNDSMVSLARDGVNDAVFGAGFGCDRRFYEAFPPCRGNPPKHLDAQDIIFPFLAGFLSGVVILTVPLMKYRIHGNQNSLSVKHSNADSSEEKLLILEKIWRIHLSHSIWMTDTLNLIFNLDKIRFASHMDLLTEPLKNQVHIMSYRVIDTYKKLFYGCKS